MKSAHSTVAVVMAIGALACGGSQANAPSPALATIPTPTPAPTPVPGPGVAVEVPISPGTVTLYRADNAIAYNWIAYIPASITKAEASYVLLTAFHGNLITNDYERMTQESMKLIEVTRSWAQAGQKYIMLTAVVPRPEPPNQVYAVAFDRRSWDRSRCAWCYRPDLQVNLITDRFIWNLRRQGYNVQTRVFIEGFSAGAMFAQRYTMIHPDRVQAAAAGNSGGALTLPDAKFDGVTLDWLLGVNDFPGLMGSEFQHDAYKRVPQLIYIGDQDVKNSTIYPGTDLYTNTQIEYLNSRFGASDPVRLQEQVAYLNQAGYSNVRFKLYPGVAHNKTDQIWNDLIAFFDSNRSPR